MNLFICIVVHVELVMSVTAGHLSTATPKARLVVRVEVVIAEVQAVFSAVVAMGVATIVIDIARATGGISATASVVVVVAT